MMQRRPDPPFGCKDCWPDDPVAAWEARRSLVRSATLVDDSHLGISVLACSACSQAFVSLFIEFVDWSAGDDAQYWTLIPVTDDEVSSLHGLDEAGVVAGVNALPQERRSLRHDHPTGEDPQTTWGLGVNVA